MVQFTQGENAACGRILLCPNNAAGWKGNQQVIQAAALLGFGIALVCYLKGAVLVTLFSGVEIGVLYWLLRRVSHDCARQEVVVLTPDEVIIQKGHHMLEQEWHFQRYSTQVQISEPCSQPHLHGDIAFCCRQEAVHLGSFLGDEERLALIAELRRLIGGYRQIYLRR